MAKGFPGCTSTPDVSRQNGVSVEIFQLLNQLRDFAVAPKLQSQVFQHQVGERQTCIGAQTSRVELGCAPSTVKRLKSVPWTATPDSIASEAFRVASHECHTHGGHPGKADVARNQGCLAAA